MKLIFNNEEYHVSEEQLLEASDYILEETIKLYTAIPFTLRSTIKMVATNYFIPLFVKKGILKEYPHRNEDPVFLLMAGIIGNFVRLLEDGIITIELQADEQHNVTATSFFFEQEQSQSESGGQLGISGTKRKRKNNIRKEVTTVA